MNTFIFRNLKALHSYFRFYLIPVLQQGLHLRRRIIIIMLLAVMAFCAISLTGCSNKICPAYNDVSHKHK